LAETRLVKRLDHVAVVVRDTEAALRHFSGRLGLEVVSSEVLVAPRVRLTYLDLGNTLLQLVEPLEDGSAVAAALAENGEGLHHLCFAVESVVEAATVLADPPQTPALGSGRGRASAFVPGPVRHGVRLECTEFRRDTDLGGEGWLA
jgi:methylmalonyl-CoA/ethylmalonyl-CoA epimerase